MPNTIATALVLLIAVVPGAVGSYFYDLVCGLDWRERDWHAAIRYLAFSVFGLAAYVLLAALLGWWPAIHVIPATYATSSFHADLLARILVPWAGHTVSAGAVGLAAAWVALVLAKVSSTTPRPCAWDAFVRDSTPHRWVVVTLKSGDVFAGYLRVADTGVSTADRDLVLAEPAKYDEASGNYAVTVYNDLYLPAELIQNLATLAVASDMRVGPAAGKDLFPRGAAND